MVTTRLLPQAMPVVAQATMQAEAYKAPRMQLRWKCGCAHCTNAAPGKITCKSTYSAYSTAKLCSIITLYNSNTHNKIWLGS